MSALKLKIDLNVLNHLGLGLYSSTPAIVTEIVSNAWDADAHNVSITIDPSGDLISVEDDGHGMTETEVQNKFLNVGFSRRDAEANKNLSRSGTRHVMGRKGIGKLAMLSLAKEITVVTKSEIPGSQALAFRFNVPQLLEDIRAGKIYDILPVDVPADFTAAKGTRIILASLNSHIDKTEAFLRPRLARRFAVLDPKHNFTVRLNSRPITLDDRGYYKDVQFLWSFDNQTVTDMVERSPNIASVTVAQDGGEVPPAEKCVEVISGTFTLPESGAVTTLSVTGFIATVDKPAKLGKDDESINQISIFANGRVFQVDVLNEIGDARHFNQYIVGEVHADFLDRDNIDRATASRESVKHNDPRYQSLIAHLKTSLAVIRDKWDVWRVALKLDPTETISAVIQEWYDSLPEKRDRNSAERLIGSIMKTQYANDETKDQNIKLLLLQSAISGFEKLRVRRQLEKLDNVSDVLTPEFAALFANMDDIEESYYLDITRQRLEVIEKFQDIVDQQHLEKVVQRYIYKHLWLLDPTWDRISGTEEMEVTLTDYLKRVAPETEEGARLDIAYMTSSSRHVIVELKRPGIKTTFDKLRDQARKYIAATNQYYEEHPDAIGLNGRTPPIEVYILVSEKPKPLLSNDEISLRFDNIQYLTYGGLILNARKAYHDYFSARQKVSRIDKILVNLKGLAGNESGKKTPTQTTSVPATVASTVSVTK